MSQYAKILESRTRGNSLKNTYILQVMEFKDLKLDTIDNYKDINQLPKELDISLNSIEINQENDLIHKGKKRTLNYKINKLNHEISLKTNSRTREITKKPILALNPYESPFERHQKLKRLVNTRLKSKAGQLKQHWEWLSLGKGEFKSKEETKNYSRKSISEKPRNIPRNALLTETSESALSIPPIILYTNKNNGASKLSINPFEKPNNMNNQTTFVTYLANVTNTKAKKPNKHSLSSKRETENSTRSCRSLKFLEEVLTSEKKKARIRNLN